MRQDMLWLRDQLKLYEKRPESWKARHDEAMHCLDFENWLAHGVFLFERITRMDERHREITYANPDAYSAELDQEIRGLYEAWFRAIPDSLDRLADLESRGFRVEKADEYRRYCEEAVGILTPDNEFFVGDKLVALRDEAIDSHLAGGTLEGLADREPKDVAVQQDVSRTPRTHPAPRARRVPLVPGKPGSSLSAHASVGRHKEGEARER